MVSGVRVSLALAAALTAASACDPLWQLYVRTPVPLAIDRSCMRDEAARVVGNRFAVGKLDSVTTHSRKTLTASVLNRQVFTVTQSDSSSAVLEMSMFWFGHKPDDRTVQHGADSLVTAIDSLSRRCAGSPAAFASHSARKTSHWVWQVE